MTSFKLRESDILITETASPDGKVDKCEFRINDIAIGKVNGIWRQVKIIDWFETTINGKKLLCIEAGWQSFENGRAPVTKAPFVPLNCEILPDTDRYRQDIRKYKMPFVVSEVPANVANFIVVRV